LEFIAQKLGVNTVFDPVMKILICLPQGISVQKKGFSEFEMNLPNAIIKSQFSG